MDLAAQVFAPARNGQSGFILAALAIGVILSQAASALPASEAMAGLCVLLTCGALVFGVKRIADRADPRLKAGDASYRAFFDHAIEGIFRTTPEGRYIDANPALARIYGYSSPSHLILGLTDIGDQLYVDPRRRQEFQRLMQANDQVSRFESEIRRRDGSTIWIAENARAVRDWSGKIVCYEGMVEDVTARYAAQMAMRKALKEAEEANRAKSAFLAAMSHELKTPLNAVLGFSEIMAGEMLGPISPPAYRGYAVDIHASGTRLLSIISDILDVARLSGGAITLNAQPFAPMDLAESALALARQATRDEREVLVDVPPTLPDIDADPQRLRQCLANIISNALKFTGSGGQVAVHAWIERSGGVSFSVRDQGIGMAPEKIAAALEPFRQLDGSLARKFEGTGLGLSIAKSLAELHGGSLTVESSVGHGTTVTVALPPARTCPREALAS